MIHYLIPLSAAAILAINLLKDWSHHHRFARIVQALVILLWACTNIVQLNEASTKHDALAVSMHDLQRQNAELLKSNSALKDQNSDSQARQVQLVEQTQVLQRCLANPKSGACAKRVGAHFTREVRETMSFRDSVRPSTEQQQPLAIPPE